RASSLERTLGRGNRVGLTRVDLNGSAQHARDGLEAGLGDMVAIVAVEIGHVQRDPRILRKRMKELAHELGVETAHAPGRKSDVPDEVGPAGNVYCRPRQRLVHG